MSLLSAEALVGRSFGEPNPVFEDIRRFDQAALTGDLDLDGFGDFAERTRRPRSALGWALDLLNRGEYVAASILNSALEGDVLAFGGAFKEFVLPDERRTFHDILRERSPDFVRDHPVLSSVLSLTGSIAADPLTWLSFGSTGALKVLSKTGGKLAVLEKEGGTKVLRRVMDNLDDTGLLARERAEQGVLDVLGITRAEAPKATTALRDVTTPEGKAILTRMEDDLKRQTLGTQRVRMTGRVLVPLDPDQAKNLAKTGKIGDTVEALPIGEFRVKAQQPPILAVVSEDARVLTQEGTWQIVGDQNLQGKVAGFLVGGNHGLVSPSNLGRALSKGKGKFKYEEPPPQAVLEAYNKRVGTSQLVRDTMAQLGLEPKDLLRKSGLRLRVPFTRIESRTLISTEDTVKFLQAARVLPAMKAVAQLAAPPSFVKEAFSRRARIAGAGLSSEDGWRAYEQLKAGIEGQVLHAREEAVQSAMEILGVAGKDRKSREKIAQVLAEGVAVTEKLRPREAHRAWAETARKAGLTLEEMRAVARVRKAWTKSGEAEAGAHFLKDWILSATPESHAAGKSAATTKAFRAKQLGLRALDAGDVPMLKALEEARSSGRSLDIDALELLSVNYLDKRFKEIEEVFTESLESLFPKTKKGAKGRKKLPDAVREDFFQVIRPLGYPDWLGDGKWAVQTYDWMLSVFRKGATIWKPAFAGRTAIGNGLQSFVATGKVTDPSSMLLAMRTVASGKLPEELGTAVGKLTREDLSEALERFPVMQGVAVEGIGEVANFSTGVQKVAKELEEKALSSDLLRGHAQRGQILKGFTALAKRSIRYTDWPTKIDDLSRLSVFFDRLGLGYSPAQAFEETTKALFNYRTGLTQFERTYMRRLVPFYSFQKFALGLLGNAVKESPGRLSTSQDVFNTFFGAWAKLDPVLDGKFGEEQLTDQERYVLPGFLLEQPTFFAGWDPTTKKAAFRTLSGLNFLDFVGAAQFDDEGEFDPGKTLVHGAAAQLAPFVKVPLSLVLGVDFFSGHAISPHGRSIGDVDSEELVRNLAGAVGGAALGSIGAQIAGYLGGAVDPGVGETVIKALLSWEEGVDPRDGKQKVWVNPAAFMIAGDVFPPLKQALALSRRDRNWYDDSVRWILGVGRTDVDIPREALKLQQRRKLERDTLVRVARRRFQEQREGSAQAALRELRTLVQQTVEEAEFLGASYPGSSAPETEGALP